MDQDTSTAGTGATDLGGPGPGIAPGDTKEAITTSLETAAGGAEQLTGAVADSIGKPAPTDEFQVSLGRAHDRIAALENFASGMVNNLPSLAVLESRAAALEDFASALIAGFRSHFGGKIDLPEAPGAAPSPVQPRGA